MAVIVLSLIVIASARHIDTLVDYLALLKPLPAPYTSAIEKYNSFYQKLPDASQKIFLRKVKYFLRTKEFIPRQMPHVTTEMKALISSAAVQITFGFPRVSLMYFKRILVYPDEYYSIINKQYHKGEVNPRLKAIVVSWKAFVAGYADPDDGINLGLHEMAHALKLENMIRNDEFGFFGKNDFQKWQSLARDEINNIRSGKETIFREYAGTDEDEFFATSIELYFELPGKLNRYNPELYRTLSKLLRQDTLQLVG